MRGSEHELNFKSAICLVVKQKQLKHWRILKMKKIVCELCEGTQFDKVDGRFVCKGCGTSYSAEEARGMMREVEGEEPVSTGAPAMPVGNPNQQQLDNILMLATNAYSADNNQETENYCNRAIELDATCYKAWILKGKAIGWSSSIKNNRMEEAAHSFLQGINFAPDEDRDKVREEATEELKRLGLACASVQQKNFSRYPDDEELNGFVTILQPLVNALTLIADKNADTSNIGGALAELTALLSKGNAKMRFLSMKMKGTAAGIPEDFFNQIALMMNAAGVAGFKTVRERYNNDSKPDRNDFKKALNEADNCIELIQMAIDASDDDDDEDITRYENIKIIYQFTIDLKAYANYSDYSRNWMLTDAAKNSRRDSIKDCDKKIAEIKDQARKKEEEERKKAEEEKQARIAAYWEAHADEKAALDSELKELNEKKSAWDKEIADIESEIKAATPTGNVPSENEKSKIRDQISDLNNRRAKLGMFAGKEKKQIGEEIASLEGRMSALDGKIEEEKRARKAEADQKVAPLNAKKKELTEQRDAAIKRITAINKELTKDPEE